MTTGSIVLTGVAQHWLGEAIAYACVRRTPPVPIVGIDRVENPDLSQNSMFQHLEFDLNPLNSTEGFRSFGKVLLAKLSGLVQDSESEGVEYLVQCAGAYDRGMFVDYDAERRARVLGLNILGAIEVLHTVMSLNDRLGWQNNERFTHILVGSFQGLNVREERSIYAASKAFGIDLCASMVAGCELAKCMYVAPGPLDTPMLHRNHWVSRAGGSEEFFDKVLKDTRDRYRLIFVNCDESPLETQELRDSMSRYRKERHATCVGTLGILAPEACATAVVDVLMSPEAESGVYGLTADEKGSVAALTMVRFSELDRSQPFNSRSARIEKRPT